MIVQLFLVSGMIVSADWLILLILKDVTGCDACNDVVYVNSRLIGFPLSAHMLDHCSHCSQISFCRKTNNIK